MSNRLMSKSFIVFIDNITNVDEVVEVNGILSEKVLNGHKFFGTNGEVFGGKE